MFVVTEPNFMLCLFGHVRDTPVAIEKHQAMVKAMTAEEYKAASEQLYVLGGHHTLAAMKQFASEDVDFRQHITYKYINPQYVYYFPCRNKHFISLAR